MATDGGRGSGGTNDAREARLKAQLRENLKRRKARARLQEPPPEVEEGDTADTP